MGTGDGLNRRDFMSAATLTCLSFANGCRRQSAWWRAGVDVSADNGSVDWHEVARSGIGFAYLRATDGARGVDPAYATNCQNAQRAGIHLGAYHVFNMTDDPIRQAEWFIAHAQFSPGDLPPMLDLEAGPSADRAEVFVQAVQHWLSQVTSHLRDRFGSNRQAGVYLRTDIWRAAGRPDWSSNPLWIAEWDVSQPHVPSVWSDYAFWQHTDRGRVPGIGGYVDLSRGSSLADRYRL